MVGCTRGCGGQAPLALALDDLEGYRSILSRPRLPREVAVLVISSFQLIMRAPELAQDLVVDNIGTAVRQCFMTKPLDEPAIGKAVRFKHRRVVVGANISAIGSMGDALARTLQRHGLQPACLIPRIADAT